MTAKLDTSAAAQLIGGNRLFAGLPPALLDQLLADVELTGFDTNDLIFREGESGDCLYLVCEGCVRISKAGRGGQQETLGFINAGDFFGEMALIDGKPRSAQAAAAAPTVLGRVNRDALQHILELSPGDLHLNFLRGIVARLRDVDSHFIAELTRNERLSTVGAMANSIIHDLRNPIQVVRSCSELFAQRFPDPTALELTRLMDKAVDGMLDMIQELLDFARGQSSVELRRAPAVAVIEELHAQLLRAVPQNIHLIKEVTCDASILVDVGRLARALLNLVKNAIEAMPRGGILWTGIREEGNRVIFRIADTGCGIPEELRARIFEPFVTHGKSKGTGLGLAIVKSVVEAHCGIITVESRSGIGTTFEISVPMALG